MNGLNPPPDEAGALADTHAADAMSTHTATTSTWGPFALLEEVGRGGFATVYRAWDPQLRREIALKVMLPARVRAGSSDDVLREGQLIARVRHPNVVTVYSVQREGEAIGLAMEFVRGRTLAALVAQNGPLDAAEAAAVGSYVCDALDAVHALGLVHRDVKASNVMREDNGRIVLMDFGAGRDLSGDYTAAGIIGTPQYVAPEVLLGARVTAGADLYSLAVLLFFLVTGTHPVDGKDFAEIGRAHRLGQRRRLRDARPDLPAAFVELIDTALAAEPSKRFTTAGAFRRALQATLPSDRQFRPSSASTSSEASPHQEHAGTPLTTLQRIVLATLGGVVLCGAMGFVTTTAFNIVLGRTGDFAAEGVQAYFVWGVRSLVAPTVWIVGLLVLFNIGAMIVGTLSAHLALVKKACIGIRNGGRRLLHALGMRNANTLGQGLSVAAAALLAVIAWSFGDLLGALASKVNDSPAAELAVLGSGHYDTHLSYRITLNLVVLMLAASIVTVLRYSKRHAEVLQPATVISLVGVFCLALIMMALPWRILFNDTFPTGSFGERECFILSATSESTLISCPASPAPRNVVLKRGDSRLSDQHNLGNIFDAFEAVSASQ